MALPSASRIMVEFQKAVTQAHRRLLQSPAAPLLARLPGGRILVLHTIGRKSGKARQTPLSFTRDGDSYVVIGSDGGAPRHPDWYLNLGSTRDVAIDVAGKEVAVRAETVTGPERQRLWDAAVRSAPGYAAYQRRTSREIPVVRLTPKR